MNRQILIDTITASTKLPALSHSATRLIALGNEADVYPAKIHTVLAGDPILAARVLQVSNSAMFARQGKVTDLGSAIAILGVRLTLSIALGFCVVDTLREQETYAFDYDGFWRKSVLAAIAANEMYDSLNAASRGELFVASLMQDIGILVLLETVGDKYARLVAAARSHYDLYEFEWRAFGIDHAEIGALLAERWQLPTSIQCAIGASHALFAEQTGSASCDPISDLEYGVACSGVLAELWIGESTDPQASSHIIKAYLEKVGEQAYKNTIESILVAIPGANEIFNMQLLSEEQMASVA